jgi:tetratricopeptide (TPR) repeat protein
LNTLEQLIAAGQSCGDEPLLSKKYAVHFNYAAVLESEDKVDQAIRQYQSALAIDPHRREALEALVRLDALPRPTPPACRSTASPRPDPAPAEPPDHDRFVMVQGDQLQLEGQPFAVKGLNYYPRRTPWQQFLTQANPAEMAEELDLIRQAGFNTIRIFLWYEPLFTCQPEEAIPNEAAFATVDTLFELAGQRNLKNHCHPQ